MSIYYIMMEITPSEDNDEDDIEALEAYDEACEYGVSAVFYTCIIRP